MNRKVLAVTIGAAAYLAWDLFERVSVRHNRGIAKGKRIVILGGGFGGTEAAKELERLLPGEENGEIVLVDEHEFMLFTPMLTEAVGGDVEPHHIVVPLKSFVHRSKVVTGEVKAVDLISKTVEISGPEPQTLQADHLILALGASSNFHHATGVEQNAVTMKTLEDAIRVKEGALALVKAAAREPDREKRSAMLTFLIAGGGYTGVETIAALNDMVRETASGYDLDLSEIRMILVEQLGRLMSEVTEDLANYSQKELEKSGIRVQLKTGVKSADADSVELTSGERIRARTFIWTAGVEANKLIGEMDAPKGKGKTLKVSGDLSLEGYPGVWAIGDCAEIPKPDGKGSYGPTAQNATREGKLVARNIVQVLRGRSPSPFRYTPIGELAIVGRRRGTARVYNQNFSGFLAFAMWRFVYFAKMPSVSQRLRVLSDWMLDAVLPPVSKFHYLSVPARADKVERSQHTAASAR